MSRQRSPGAHVAIKAPQEGFLRRHLGVIIVLGGVLAVGGPAAQAADGDHLVSGKENYSSSRTSIASTAGDGLLGYTTSTNVEDSGLYGNNAGGGAGVRGYSRYSDGVSGRSGDPLGSGVYGYNLVGGYGVTGRVSDGGVAVWADDSGGNGVALRTSGKIQFQKRSNTIVIAPGQKSKTITIPGVTAASRVLATVQRAGGYFVQGVVPGPGSFTIYINKAAPANQNVPVGYLVIN